MDQITKMFDEMIKSETYVNVAARANVSRSTLANIRTDPERSTFRVLRRVIEAMGYKLVIKLERADQ